MTAQQPQQPDRIEGCFSRLRQENRAGLVTFSMAGDPDPKTSLEIIRALPTAGADIIELGMPFSDPMADGRTIQEAGQRALAQGIKLRNILDIARDFRITHPQVPLILMGYYNPVYHYGIDDFAADATAAGVDGVILVDLPPEEEDEFRNAAEQNGLHIIRLLTPTSNDERLPLLLEHASGFCYYVAVTGITGSKSADYAALQQPVKRIQSISNIPVAVGFGIKTPQQAAQVAAYADAVVVGSALVDVIAREKSPQAAAEFVSELSAAMSHAQKAAG